MLPVGEIKARISQKKLEAFAKKIDPYFEDWHKKYDPVVVDRNGERITDFIGRLPKSGASGNRTPRPNRRKTVPSNSKPLTPKTKKSFAPPVDPVYVPDPNNSSGEPVFE